MSGLVLRDIHEPVAPPWWPPAPGWWLVVAVLAGVLAVVVAVRWRRARRRRRIARWFDETVAAADTPAGRIAAISELLRRAARRIDPAAAALDGEDWLRFLDGGLPQPVFARGEGALLRDGAFRPEVDADAVEALRVVARARFLDWMGARP